jgi:predicted CoA-binding protein
MSRTPDTISTLRDVLHRCRTLAVVGLSPQWHRPSYFAAKYMQSHGYRIIPVNPLVAAEGCSILGERCFASVVEAAQADRLSRAGTSTWWTAFRKSADIPPLAEEAIAIGARCLWLQLGVVNEAAAERAEAAGLQVIQNRCVKIEHARLFGGLGWAGVNTRVISAKRPQQLPY